MMIALSRAVVWLITLAGLFLSTPAFARDWTFTDLGTLGGVRSFAYAINDLGQIVGLADTTDGNTHSFLYSNGQMTDLSPLNSESWRTEGPSSIDNLGEIASGVMSQGVYYPGIYDSRSHQINILGSLGGLFWYAFSGVATAVNNSGQAVGYSYLDGLNRHAFIYQNGTMTDLGSLGGYSEALDINDSGVAVGFASDTVDGVGVASIWAGGAITTICGNRESEAYGINNRGQVVGEQLNSTATAFHAFLYSDGIISDLEILQTGQNSTAYQINSRGQIVGSADVISSIDAFRDPDTGQIVYRTNYEDHAFLYEAGAMVDLNTVISTNSGWVLSYAMDINETGQIVGYGLRNGEWRGYLITPPHNAFRIGSDGSPTAGSAYTLTITAVDQYQNIVTTVTGNHSFTFAGLAVADDGTYPTITDRSGNPVNLGTATTITFTNGVSSAGGSLLAYKGQTATLKGSDATSGKGTSDTGGTDANLTIANVNPVAGADTETRDPSVCLKILKSKLVGLATDANHDVLSVSGVETTSTGGATLSTNATYVLYQPNGAGDGDTFTYTVSDGNGGTATGTVTVRVAIQPGAACGQIRVSGGVATVKMFGIPGVQYDIQRSTDLNAWTTLLTAPPLNTASPFTASTADGSFSFTDSFSDLGSPPPAAYYRLLEH